jgi:putative membrane protein
MHSWDGDMGIWGYTLMSISMLVVWGAIIAGIVLLARSLRASNQQNLQFPSRRTPEDLLCERFARGDIDAAEYQGRLDVLRRQPGP